jgi:C1A family cysteine protease
MMGLKGFEEQNILLYCKDGTISNLVRKFLSEHNFNHVYSLKGGIDSWKKSEFSMISCSSDKIQLNSAVISLNGHGLGLIVDTTPPTSIVIYNGDHPDYYDWRNAKYKEITGDWTTPIKDQGECGSCYAFATIAAVESKLNIKMVNPDYSDSSCFDKDVDFSEQFIVSCGSECYFYDEDPIGGCLGATFDGGLNFIKTHGTIPEKYFEYDSEDFSGTQTACGSKNQITGWTSKIYEVEFGDLTNSNDYDIKTALFNEGPIITTMVIYESFINYKKGQIYEPKSGEDPIVQDGKLAGHMVSIVGYNDNQGYWICKNSWGTNWGENGFFKIKYGVCGINSRISGYSYSPRSAYVKDINKSNKEYSEVGVKGDFSTDDRGRYIIAFTNVKVDTHVTGTVTLCNSGTKSSLLDWRLLYNPSGWVRTYKFEPDDGYDLSINDEDKIINFDFYVSEGHKGETLETYFTINDNNNCVDKRALGIKISVKKDIGLSFDIPLFRSFCNFKTLMQLLRYHTTIYK